MNNAEWCIKNNIRFKDLRNEPCFDSQFESIGYYGISGQYHECYKGKVLGNTVAASILTWLDMEHKDPILDDAEKRYLSAVIRPFRNKVKFICKSGIIGEPEWSYQYVFISFRDGSHDIDFPFFRTGTMYKGMELDREYKLEELGL